MNNTCICERGHTKQKHIIFTFVEKNGRTINLSLLMFSYLIKEIAVVGENT